MDAYIEKKTIGRGAFAIVRLVERKSTGENRVVKKFHTSMGELSDKERTEIAQEVKLLAVLRHPNVIGYFDNFVDVSYQAPVFVNLACSAREILNWFQSVL
jgi:NIMA (never in mitosis gene a)-related kinase